MKPLVSFVMALFLGTTSVGVVALDSQAAPRNQIVSQRVLNRTPRQNRVRPDSSRYMRRGYIQQNRTRRGQQRLSPRRNTRPISR
ncbi:hypothetical protein I8752_14330 [Nostocaceae cyanobacterium CENA369]|uniref:Uncharacterized protein n=1 Tax=Dendronalium phyllosphericum CENA369 TaxID=1725256 RepID=A0A8J7I9S5_9NOST|nr:hypothetical protein [Dendronalium phyllosphericum]MBH8574172.1 hypothetical protein [Dendronalium phyllosphericum CENA369]